MSDTRGWSLRRRLERALAGLAVLLVVVTAVAIVLLLQVRHGQQVVTDRYFTAVATANARFVAQVDAETAVRGYALTGDRKTLQPAEQIGRPAYQRSGTRLTALVGDATTRAGLRSWDAASNRWYTAWATPTVSAINAHGGNSVSNHDVIVGKRLFDANRAQYGAVQRDLLVARTRADQSLRHRTDLLFVAVMVAVLALVALSVWLWWALRRWVVAPMSDLAAETRLVRTGDLEHAVAITGPNEIRALATDVEAMRLSIVSQLAEVERARVEIEAARVRLEAQTQELERSNRDLEQFAYVASHDLQEPLRKVTSFCQMLERRYAGQLDDRADTYIGFAVDGAKRMQQLINDLLAFSRVGRSTVTMIDVALEDCFTTASNALSETLEAAGARITHDALPVVHGEPALLTQLLQNLVGNAVKFRGSDPPVVHIGAQRHDDDWELCCSDNGIGIEPRYAERIFVIFQRLHGKDEYVGTGIGLALCKRIVEFHGGQLWLDTSAERGATFRWTLPIPVAEVAADTVSEVAADTATAATTA